MHLLVELKIERNIVLCFLKTDVLQFINNLCANKVVILCSVDLFIMFVKMYL